MNNEFIIEEYNEFNDSSLPRLPFMEQRLGKLKGVLEALNGFKNSESYKSLKKYLLDSRLETLTRQMRSEVDPIKLYRLQGKINELENFVNLDLWIKVNENEFNNLKVVISKQKDAQKEKERNSS